MPRSTIRLRASVSVSGTASENRTATHGQASIMSMTLGNVTSTTIETTIPPNSVATNAPITANRIVSRTMPE